MQLQALLTTRWKTDPNTPSSAAHLHKTASHAGDKYSEALSAALKSLSKDFQVLGLVRRCRDGRGVRGGGPDWGSHRK